MPKKKKKGGSKLDKMSEEERILYLEQKALAEEEMRKKEGRYVDAIFKGQTNERRKEH